MYYQVYNKITQKRDIQSLFKIGKFLFNKKLCLEYTFSFYIRRIFLDDISFNIFNKLDLNIDSIIKTIVSDNIYNRKHNQEEILHQLFFKLIDDNFEIFDEKCNKINDFVGIINLYKIKTKELRNKQNFTRKYRKSISFRKIKTTNEIRQNCYICKEDLEPPIRASRKKLPDNRHDILTIYSACWKDQSKRKHQYKNK